MRCDSTFRHEPTHRPTSMNPFSSTFFAVMIEPISNSTPFIISACWNLIKCGTLWHGWLQVPVFPTDLSSPLVTFDATRASQNGPLFSRGETRLEDDRPVEDRLVSPRRIKLGRKFPKPVAIAKSDVARRVECMIVYDEINWSVKITGLNRVYICPEIDEIAPIYFSRSFSTRVYRNICLLKNRLLLSNIFSIVF